MILAWVLTAAAHDLRPAVLNVTQLDPIHWTASWVHQGPLQAHFEGCTEGEVLTCDSLDAIEISGFTPASQVLVRARPRQGAVQQALLHGETRRLELRHPAPALARLGSYVAQGVKHIWLGFDHLLFVLGLCFLVPNPLGVTDARWGPLVKTLTAFTVAHSITLAASALGWLRLPGPPVEAVIALSIVLLAREMTRSDGAIRRRPWAVAFGFGLIHGFGFAGALADLGLEQDLTLSLVGFNVGVELGQLIFVGAIYLLARTAAVNFEKASLPAAYFIGALASAWTIERLLGMVT